MPILAKAGAAMPAVAAMAQNIKYQYEWLLEFFYWLVQRRESFEEVCDGANFAYSNIPDRPHDAYVVVMPGLESKKCLLWKK